VNRKNNIILDH